MFALEAPYIVGPMAAGQYNTMVAAARKGKTPNTFAWGPNYNSQLGHQFLELGPLPTPSKLDLLKTANIVQVRFCVLHSGARGRAVYISQPYSLMPIPPTTERSKLASTSRDRGPGQFSVCYAQQSPH